MKNRLADPELVVTAVTDTSAALRILSEQPIDCMVLGPGAEDLTDGLLATAEGPVRTATASLVATRLPVIVYGDGIAP